MPFTLGFYDLFSYLIPGMLYLYVINETMRFLKVDISALFPGMSFSSLPDYGLVVFLLVLALIAGHIFDPIAQWFITRLIYRKKAVQTTLDRVKSRNSTIEICFEAKDWNLLLFILRQRNLPVAQTLDKYNADSIMLRNISLMAFVMSWIMLVRAILENPLLWIAFLVAILVCFLAAQRSQQYLSWLFEGVFITALEYGTSVKEVLEQDKTQSLEHSVRLNWSRNKSGKE